MRDAFDIVVVIKTWTKGTCKLLENDWNPADTLDALLVKEAMSKLEGIQKDSGNTTEPQLTSFTGVHDVERVTLTGAGRDQCVNVGSLCSFFNIKTKTLVQIQFCLAMSFCYDASYRWNIYVFYVGELNSYHSLIIFAILLRRLNVTWP